MVSLGSILLKLIYQKRSLLGQEIEYSKETLANFVQLLDAKKINLLGIGNMQKEELIDVGEAIGLEKVKKKPLELLRKEVEHLGKLAIAGQVRFLKFQG